LGKPRGTHREWELHCKYLFPLSFDAPPFALRTRVRFAGILVMSFCLQHGAIRTTLSGPADYENDDESGFQRIEAREIDTIGALLPKDMEGKYGRSLFPNAGTAGIIKKIRETVGDRPVYLSIDVRCLF
jgi:hypothetical protein